MKLSPSLLVLILFFTTTFSLKAQRIKSHPLSRDDSAQLIEFKKKSDDFLARSNDKTASDWMNRIARLYWDHNYFEEAAEYYEQSLALNKKLGNENGIAMINSNLGLIYNDMQNFEKAKKHFEETLAARRAKKEKFGMISALINLSVVLNSLKRYNESAEHLEEALVLAKERNDPDQMKSCYGMLSDTYRMAGNPEKSASYFKLYQTFHDMINKKKVEKAVTDFENQKLKTQLAEFEKRNKELELVAAAKEIEEKDSTNRRLSADLMQKQLELQDAEIKSLKKEKELADERRKRQNIFVVVGLLGGLLVLAYFVIRNTRRTNKKLEVQNQQIREQSEEILAQNEEIEVKNRHLEDANNVIEHKNTQITASINYASLIQSASLFHQVSLSELIPNSFLFFRPKDVVSGDFYWYNKVGDKMIVSAVDCTGHGVPGGFMSMIANNLLSDAIMSKGIHEPAEILAEVDEGVRVALNQCHSGNNDGMDMALCVIDYKNRTLKMGGARNPVILIQDGELSVVKTTRRSVGGCHATNKLPNFDQTEMPMKEQNYIYMFSDGFQDQFGGKQGRKFGGKKFRMLLEENHKLPFDQQHQVLSEELDKWKNEYSQVDDLLVIGLKV